LDSSQRVGSQRLVIWLHESGSSQPFTVQPVTAYTAAATPVVTIASAGLLELIWQNWLPVSGSGLHTTSDWPLLAQAPSVNTMAH
jgi:hypothetical protein